MAVVSPSVATQIPATSGTNGHAPRQQTRGELIDALMRTEGKAEIINGRIKRFMASGLMPGKAAINVMLALRFWKRETGATGETLADGFGFLCDLPNRQSFEPDASYYTGASSGMKFLPHPPVFAVEVRSEGDYGTAAGREIEAKRADYFATAFTEVVWDVDLLSETATVRKFTRDGGAEIPVAVFKRGESADAEPAVPGFTMPVDDLFE